MNLINLLVSHPNLFSQQETTLGWIEQTNVRAWVKIVQPLFAYLNHQDSFVRETFKSLIEQIGNTYPHAVCYPTFVRANQLTEQNNEEEPSKVVSNQVSFARRKVCENAFFPFLEHFDKRNLC